jgi:hypothetical protein
MTTIPKNSLTRLGGTLLLGLALAGGSAAQSQKKSKDANAVQPALSATDTGSNRGAPHGAPEIDVTYVGAAAAVLLGGLLILTTVRRKKLARS